LQKGLTAQFLSAAEANTERDILLHFAPKLQPRLRQGQAKIAALEEQLVAEQARLTPLMVQLSRFAQVKEPPIVPVFLVANPEEHNGGGGAYGGRLVVEVPLLDAIGTLLHESLHQLLDPQKDLIRSAAEAAALDYTVLNEGIAYALYPGIMADNEQGDRLVQLLVRMQLSGTPASDPFLKFDQVAAVIRPLLRAALANNETIAAFLPETTAKWHSVAARSPLKANLPSVRISAQRRGQYCAERTREDRIDFLTKPDAQLLKHRLGTSLRFLFVF
jgi:hypothetical protein